VNRPVGVWRLDVREQLPSTQNLALMRAAEGEAEGLAILARVQTAGRGRGARVWDSRPGNLHLSVLLRPTGPARDLPSWALLFAVALRDAAAALRPEVRLKWPNDLLLGEAKAGGVLTEAELTPEGAGIAHLVAGFGVNLAHAPEIPGRATAALGAEEPEVFARRLLDRIAHWRTTRLLEGFAPIRAAWLAAGPERGAPVALRRDGGEVHGRFEGLAEDGALLLSTGGRVHAFHTGEVGETS
jgi:BirA family biotin operon repressor/biotin-[acetyl-CoA-carboxylase] ligase